MEIEETSEEESKKVKKGDWIHVIDGVDVTICKMIKATKITTLLYTLDDEKGGGRRLQSNTQRIVYEHSVFKVQL